MFCSNCGKTIRPEDDACQHCGARLGEARFYGNAYTSSQVRLPAEALDSAPEGGMISYTRTNYMSYDNQPEDDVYSNTTYRPLVSDEEDEASRQAYAEAGYANAYDEIQPMPPEEYDGAEAEEPFPEESVPEAGGDEFVQGGARRPAPVVRHKTLSQQLAEYENQGPEESTSPLPPLRKAAISPRVRTYMEELENKAQHRANGGGLRMPSFLKRREDAPYEEDALPEATDILPVEGDPNQAGAPEEGAEAPLGEADAPMDAEETDEDYGYFEEEEGASALGGVLAKVKEALSSKAVKMVLAAVAVVAVLVVGVIWLSFVTAKRAKIADVTYNTYNQGIETLKSHVGEEYRNERTTAYLANTGYANQAFEEDMNALNALMPENPADNDELFVTTLTIIQGTIADAIKADANAQLDGSSQERSDASDRDWQAIENAVQKLSDATSVSQLSALAADLQTVTAPTPTPAPPTPVTPTYTTLSSGMMDNVQVKAMQNKLINLGFLNGDADGDFGPGTEAAVKAFQQAAGMNADGIATPEVQEAMFADDAPRAPALEAPANPVS